MLIPFHARELDWASRRNLATRTDRESLQKSKKRTRQFHRVRSSRRNELLNRTSTLNLYTSRNPHHWHLRNIHAGNIHSHPRTSPQRNRFGAKPDGSQAYAGNLRFNPRPIGLHPRQRRFLPGRHGLKADYPTLRPRDLGLDPRHRGSQSAGSCLVPRCYKVGPFP